MARAIIIQRPSAAPTSAPAEAPTRFAAVAAAVASSAVAAAALREGTRRPGARRRAGRRAVRTRASGKTLTSLGPGVLPEPPLPAPRGRAVVWFRAGDLRIRDHPGLARAAAAADSSEGAGAGVCCCFIFSAREVARLSARRRAALRSAVAALSEELRQQCGGARLHIAMAATSAADEVYRLCREVGATEVYVHDDPTDVNRDSLNELRDLSVDGPTRVCAWRAPLRSAVGALGSVDAHDAYEAAVAGMPLETPLRMPTTLVEADTMVQGFQEVVPSDEDLQALQSEDVRREVFLGEVKYVRGLGADCMGEPEALRLLGVFVEQGLNAFAKDVWGSPEGDSSEPAASKEEWCFRRVARREGFGGLIAGEAFSRGLSEEMLWLGCVSLRTVAERLRQASGGASADALRAVEANEWHRLLALRDVGRVVDGESGTGSGAEATALQVKYWRWRGYLSRYLAPVGDASTAAEGPVILAVHGFAASCTQFEGLAEALGPTRPVFALDLLGFGHAEKPPLSFSQYVWEQCVKSFAVEIIGRKVVLMGNSIGGYVSQAAAASLGPSICKGLVLLNSAGPLLPPEEYEALEKVQGTVLQRMRLGYGDEAGLPGYNPPPQWLVDGGASFLFGLLQPRIEGILKSLYPTDTSLVPGLAQEILRDSKDPFASNVISSFSRLGPNRSSNELMWEYASGSCPEGDAKPRLLVCQGMADLLGGGPGNQPSRVASFVSVCPDLAGQAAPLEGCGHCPHHEAPGKVASAVKAWLEEEVCC